MKAAKLSNKVGSPQLIEKILFGAIGVGLAIAGVGITYVVDFERRISLLEARSNLVTGVSLGLDAAKTGAQEGVDKSGKDEVNPPTHDPALEKAIAEGCFKLISSYNNIAGKEGGIYSDDRERLKLLQDQMLALGCANKP